MTEESMSYNVGESAGASTESLLNDSGEVDEAAPSGPSALDPRLAPIAKNPERVEKVIVGLFVLGLLGFAAFGALYWHGGRQPQLEGVFIGVGLMSLGFGLSSWGKYLMPRGPFVEERHPLASEPQAQEEFKEALVGRGKYVLKRRGFLAGLMGLAATVFAIVAAFPFIRSLGPVPGDILDKTSWKRGSRLVTADGRPVKVDTLQVGGILTVFPEGHAGSAIAQTVLIRAADVSITTKPGRESWAPEGYIAYSKVCTHAGCPVGLYQEQTQQLLCPCHQSLFNVLDGAQPVFGPAPRPLPQLPLMIDSEGFLRAQRGYEVPIGPGFWSRS
ncbi:MAG: ubiquinol-cytochrome c reductase iron-sulfur subunit [Actinobacteria bacterium]|jgi:ubiquinol-cytochrome c reductase iron-sulfur subunit|nr:ubiquinol-cytochrome c reductase iron-sulfur subunit [Actinomycetota bacterium]MCL6094692.1 ubiquinol-cytochrome c reductase iron-sulfur subunit [Actinomycetota bacterium]